MSVRVEQGQTQKKKSANVKDYISPLKNQGSKRDNNSKGPISEYTDHNTTDKISKKDPKVLMKNQSGYELSEIMQLNMEELKEQDDDSDKS